MGWLKVNPIGSLVSLPDWNTLFQKSTRTLGLVGGAAAETEERGFVGEGLTQGQVVSGVDGFEALRDGQRGLSGDGFRDLLGARGQVGRRDDFFDEADAQGF